MTDQSSPSPRVRPRRPDAKEKVLLLEEIQFLLSSHHHPRQIAEILGRRHNLTPRQSTYWINQAWKSFIDSEPQRRAELLARARMRYDMMLNTVMDELKQSHTRQKVVETTDKDGRPQRRVEVTRETGRTPSNVRLALVTAERADTLAGLSDPASLDPVAIDVNFPQLWSDPPPPSADPPA